MVWARCFGDCDLWWGVFDIEVCWFAIVWLVGGQYRFAVACFVGG